MRSIKFPKMFNSNNTNVWKSTEYKEATYQNMRLVLLSYKNSLSCDPYFGGMLDSLFFEQNNEILKNILIDRFYNQLAIFIPQLRIARKDIEIITNKEKGKIYINIRGINQFDFTNDLYNLVLTKENLENE